MTDLSDRQLADLLGALDTPAPAVDAGALIRRVRRRRARARRLWAAAAIALFSTGALALPGPLRRAFVSRGGSRAPDPAVAEPRRGPAAPAPATPLGVSGVAFVPGDSVAVHFAAEQERGTLRVAGGTAPELVLRATDAAGAAASFAVGAATVRVGNEGSAASYELSVPASVVSLRVLVRGRQAFALSRGSATGAAERGADGAYVVRLTPGTLR